MVRALFLVLLLIATLQASQAAERLRLTDGKIPLEQRVSELLQQLTLEEKVDLCHGSFVSGGAPRLGIPPLHMLDGRQGLRPVDKSGTRTTLMPCVLALSCTWDEAAVREFGSVLAEEMIGLKQHVLLAPMLNLVRSPLGGRNFENFGEDPILVGILGAAYIQGVQERGIGACACLLVANDCERRRHFTSSNMDERTLRELHVLPYELSVREGKVWSMMSGNNLLNGTYCAQNRHLLQELVKNEFGFDGVMITDWRAAYDTVPAAVAGTDMTTGICGYVFGEGHLLAAVKAGKVSPALLDEKVRRILRLYLRSGVIEGGSRKSKGSVDSLEHRTAARRIAAEGMVLLKNEGRLLPLRPKKGSRVLITGPAADVVVQGGGSGRVPAAVEVSPLDGLKAGLGPDFVITHLPYRIDSRAAALRNPVGESVPPLGRGKGKGKKALAEAPKEQVPDSKALTESARAADYVIFVAAGTLASEGRDLESMDLPGKQAEAISELIVVNRNVIVALVNNGAVSLEPWAQKIRALLAIHYSGEDTGGALADVLTGKVNPSAKLSYTFGRKLNDYPCHALGQWPARLILDRDPVNAGMTPEERKATHAFDTDYKEGVLAGYRWFDEKKVEPCFPFGYGLSYTSFQFSDLRATERGEQLQVVCTIKNTGSMAGAEVVQVYVAPPQSSVPRPKRELKGFARVQLNPGEARTVEIVLRPNALAFFDASAAKWKVEAGDYAVLVGNSSRDVRLQSTVHVTSNRFCRSSF